MSHHTRSRLCRTDRGFTLVELLVVIAIIAIIASLVVPNLMDAQGKAMTLKDTANLKGIYQASFEYATRKNKFPFSTEKGAKAHDHLNMLVQSSAGADLPPETFKSEVQNEFVAEKDEDGKYILDADTLSYTWVDKPARTTDTGRALSCNKWYSGLEVDGEKKSGHKNTIMLLDTQGQIVGLDMLDKETRDKYEIDDEGLPAGLTR